MEKLRTDAPLFLLGALGYPAIEILWRGYTHPTMALAGGISAVLLYRINRGLARGALSLRVLASGAAVTLIELLFGVIFNLGFGMAVWDYSEMPLSLLGQICLPYSLLWCLLSLPFCLFCSRRPLA
ncbi:MAG: hypothetical protein J5958_00815 [Clostridia bacterium]|nr:hypothetical protein [Clostridia bacterium]